MIFGYAGSVTLLTINQSVFVVKSNHFLSIRLRGQQQPAGGGVGGGRAGHSRVGVPRWPLPVRLGGGQHHQQGHQGKEGGLTLLLNKSLSKSDCILRN